MLSNLTTRVPYHIIRTHDPFHKTQNMYTFFIGFPIQSVPKFSEIQHRKTQHRIFTLEVVEEVIIDVARSLRPSMPIIDPNKGSIGPRLQRAQGAGLDLALILKQIVCLNYSHREFAGQVLPTVLVPKKPVLPPHGI